MDSCPTLLDNEAAPHSTIFTCGFDEKQSVVKICCPKEYVTQPNRVSMGVPIPKKELALGI